MKIQKHPTSITITLHPKEFFLCRNENDPDFNGEWALIHRIDMSHKGKADQEGGVFMYLCDGSQEVFIDAGFDEIGVDKTE